MSVPDDAHLKYIEEVKCPICGYVGNTPYDYERRHINDLEIHFGFNKCKTCNLQYISPRLNNDGLKLLYNSYQSSTVSGQYNVLNDVSKLEYLSFEKYITKHLPAGGKILDVGCGIGNLLNLLKTHNNIIATGIEFSEFAANQANKRGFNVICGDLISSSLPSNHFDAIILLYVLEHVPNPKEIIKEVNRLLKKNGVLMIAVPNYRYLKIAFNNKISKFFLKEKATLHPEEHLQNFTPVTLSRLLAQEGFEITIQRCAMPLGVGSVPIRILKWLLFVGVYFLHKIGYNVGGIHCIARKSINA